MNSTLNEGGVPKMRPLPLPTQFVQDATFADVLIDPRFGKNFGYCFGGDRPGPNAMLAAWSPTIDAVARRLILLPTLPWMWGHLYLVALDLVDTDLHADMALCMADVTFDEVSVLAHPGREQLEESDHDAGYWAVLRMCTGLGMIQGRGVTAQPV